MKHPIKQHQITKLKPNISFPSSSNTMEINGKAIVMEVHLFKNEIKKFHSLIFSFEVFL